MVVPSGLIRNVVNSASKYIESVRSTSITWWTKIIGYTEKGPGSQTRAAQIEDYRPGYPRFSALVASHDSFQLYRRFSNLRARLLLLKQDKLSQLEAQLEIIDRDETVTLFLGSSRYDSNSQRKSVLSEIDTTLAHYDKLVERNHRVLGYESAKLRDISSLQNWVKGNAYLARDETAYLNHGRELFSIAPSDDGVVTLLNPWVEDGLIHLHKGFREGPCSSISRDSNVHISSGSLIARLTRTLIVTLIIFFLLVPVAVCNVINSQVPRMTVIVFAIVLFVTTVSGLTNARTIEMLVAGSTYAAVLVVFVSGSNLGTE